MAKGITGTGEGFDAPSVGRLGGSGFGAHNPSPTELRSKMVQVGSITISRLRAHDTAPLSYHTVISSHIVLWFWQCEACCPYLPGSQP